MSTAVDEQTPSPTPSRSPFRLGFLPATPDDLPSSPLPSPSTSPESLSDPEAPASDSADVWPGESSHESRDDTSSPASTPESDQTKVELLTEDEAQELARGGVAAAGAKAHDLLATTAGQQHVGLYLTDASDQANIGNPLGSIAARHQGIGKVNPDTKDLLSALVGLFGYATKQINKRTEARMIDGGAGNPQPMPEPVDL